MFFATSAMNPPITNLTQIKEKILNLKGNEIEMKINRGRNRIVTLHATIISVYPSMFTIKTNDKVELDRYSYSYNDVLCGDIVF